MVCFKINNKKVEEKILFKKFSALLYILVLQEALQNKR